MGQEMRCGNITQRGKVLAPEPHSPANVMALLRGQTLGYPKAK